MQISIRNIDKSYKNKRVLNNFSLDIDCKSGKISGFVGPNGAGKTTILKVVADILGYDKGSIAVEGCSGNAVNNFENWSKENISFISASERGFHLKNSVFDNVVYFGALKGSNISNVKKNFYKYAKKLDFENFKDRELETLSTGERKKAAILCGICSETQIIILDEPTNGLDLDAVVELQETIRKVADNLNVTFLISSHDIDFLSSIANEYFFVFNGECVKKLDESMEIESIKQLYFKLRGEG